MKAARCTRRVLAAVSVLVGTSAFLVVLPGTAAPGFAFSRFGGADRFETARLIARSTFTSAPTVLLARADRHPDKFADALAGSYLAGNERAPVLLAETTRLPDATKQALAELGASKVIMLGGLDALDGRVESEVRARVATVERVGGADRFATAAQVARRPGLLAVGQVDGARTAVLTTGRQFPDPLAAGPVAYDRRFPILLTEPDRLPAVTRDALRDLAIQHVVIVGGPEAVSADVEAGVQSTTPGMRVTRIGGADRHETAALVADYAVTRFGFSVSHVDVARSDDFPDALAGGAHAGMARAAILVNPTAAAHPVPCGWLRKHSATLTSGHVLGGPEAVSEEARVELEACAAGTAATIGGPPSPLVPALVPSAEPPPAPTTAVTPPAVVVDYGAFVSTSTVAAHVAVPVTAGRASLTVRPTTVGPVHHPGTTVEIAPGDQRTLVTVKVTVHNGTATNVVLHVADPAVDSDLADNCVGVGVNLSAVADGVVGGGGRVSVAALVNGQDVLGGALADVEIGRGAVVPVQSVPVETGFDLCLPDAAVVVIAEVEAAVEAATEVAAGT